MGISKHYGPHMIINKTSIDFNKNLQYSFGMYGQASTHSKPKSNDNRGRTIDAIYLRPSPILQGGCDVMDLQTMLVLTRQTWTACKITDMVVRRVEELVKEQNLKSCKFYNRKRQHMVPLQNDLQLEGVEGISALAVVEGDDVYPEVKLPRAEDFE